MRNADANERAQSILSDFVKCVEEEQLLDVDILIRVMKELVNSYVAKQKRHRSVQSTVCR